MSTLRQAILGLSGARVVVLGDVFVDEYVTGTIERISPEAPVPVLREGGRHAVLGGAANVAANLAQLGAHVTLIGRVGVDAEAERLRGLLADAGIEDARLVADPEVPTTTKTRLLAGYQQVVRLDREAVTPLRPDDERAVHAHVEEALGEAAGALVLADYAKGVLGEASTRSAIDRARALGVPTVVDPKVADLRRYAGATFLKPNAKEARAALAEDAPPMELAERLRVLAGVDHIVLSLSERGVVAAGTSLPAPVHIPAHRLEVADVSGAGDTMVALLAAGVATGMATAEAVELANVAAGLVCAKQGTATVRAGELLDAIGGADPAPEKQLRSYDEAAQLCAAQRAEGRRVVFANGCFDILHAGHVRMLQRARALGDVLLVAVNDDASVTRLKGEGRPVVGLDDRMEVLAALEAVDFVCAFSEDTPLRLIVATRPAAIVKGGDYRAEDVVGGPEAAAWGGRVEILPTLEGRSTTNILSRS